MLLLYCISCMKLKVYRSVKLEMWNPGSVCELFIWLISVFFCYYIYIFFFSNFILTSVLLDGQITGPRVRFCVWAVLVFGFYSPLVVAWRFSRKKEEESSVDCWYKSLFLLLHASNSQGEKNYFFHKRKLLFDIYLNVTLSSCSIYFCPCILLHILLFIVLVNILKDPT